MDYGTIKYRFANSPAVKILRSEHAPLIISFFILQFKHKNRLSMPLNEMRENLAAYIDDLRTHGIKEDFLNTPDGYLDMWCDEGHRFLRKYYETGREDATLELTAETEQVLTWIQELEKREFVGTESRFLRIFGLLQEISQKSNTNVEQRIAELRQQQKNIAKEIAEIQKTGVVEIFSETQIKERFYEITDIAYRLLADFREVEQNFKEFVRGLQKERLKTKINKGQLLKYVLDTDQQIRESDQGQSFYAFYQFLSSPKNQENLDILIRTVLELPDIKKIHKNDRLIRNLKHHLIDAGEKVITGNLHLGEQLRRFLDEKILIENRRSALLLAEIKKHAFHTAQNPPKDREFITLEAGISIGSMMERTLWSPPLYETVLRTPVAHASTAADLTCLFSDHYIDRLLLKKNISQVLSGIPETTLKTVTDLFPVTRGLSEVLGYMQIAHEEPPHEINGGSQERIVLGESGRGLCIPQVIFRKEITQKEISLKELT